MRCASGRLGIGSALAVFVACRDPAPRAVDAPFAACPRDAHPDDGGRCACDPGDVPLLGACVPAAVVDGYCGPPGKGTPRGACVFPVCAADETVDVDAGCTPLLALLSGGPPSCASGMSLVVEDRRRVCIPADAACPRGAHAEGAVCAYPPGCPPGSLPTAGTCRPVVLRGPHGVPLVDLGAWVALVLGVDGGAGSAELCRPLEAHPLTVDRPPGQAIALRVRVTLSAPDDDVTRLSAEVSTQGPTASRPTLSPAVATLADRAVASLIEPLRGLGGETTATRVDVEVRCQLGGSGRNEP
jgi:hypothetical protein